MRFLSKLFKRKPAALGDSPKEFEVQHQTLGPLRIAVLDHLFPHERVKNFLRQPHEKGLNAAFLELLEELSQKHRDADAVGVLLAAGFLTFGRLETLDFILDHLPERQDAYGTVHAVPVTAILLLLPIPKGFEPRNPYGVWVQGSPEALAVKEWVAAHRARLKWDAGAQRFQLV